VLTTKTGAALIAGAASISEEKSMKIELTRAVAIAGEHHDVREVVEVEDALGRQLIAMGKAQVPTAKPAKGKKNAKNS